MTSAAQIYAEAASVRDKTGVDPAIIATIVQTESDLRYSPWTLGITHAASKGGAGSGGTWIPSPNNYGGTQPSGFWSYTNGADASQAFANYINAYQPSLAPLLSSADAFFNPTGPLLSSNYYVPTAQESAQHGSARQATIDYYTRWFSMAQQFPQDVTGSGPSSGVTYPKGITNPDPGGNTITYPDSGSATSSASSGGSFTLVPGFSGPLGLNWGGIKVPYGFLWSTLFLLGGIGAIMAGVFIYFAKDILAMLGNVGRFGKSAAAVAV